ncbi:MAG: transcription termination factor Rho [Patescibacteria group bacterium]|nr:transcription termination factor Rho [Patescibacteria group bacterium]
MAVKKVVKTTKPSVDDFIGGVKAPKVSKTKVAPKTSVAPRPVSRTRVNKSRPIMTNRPAYRKSIKRRRPMARPINRRRPRSRTNFNGRVDNRVIPDANVPTEEITGMLEVSGDNHGILRNGFTESDRDAYISNSQIRRFNLRPGDMVTGPARMPKDNERFWGLLKVEKVNGVEFKEGQKRPLFDKLTPIFPDELLKLETDKETLSTRLVDLVAPIGKGQRGLIVSPPKAGKTSFLKNIATGITKNDPKIHLMAVLVGERPEEVTDISRHVKGEVAASNFDDSAQIQIKVAELALHRAKRVVESGKDVVILLDSITRLARAYNLAMPTSGRTLSGGFDPAALFPPKKFFGAARNFEAFKLNGKKVKASLTIIGTALVETGSRMDELIYEEFKGTGNMEIHLSRRLAERRIYPAIDIQRSSTRQEQLLFSKKDYTKIVTMRRMVDILGDDEATEVMLDRLSKTKNNKTFLSKLGKG